ncbi:hypothetical protein NBRC116590_24430 [Pelagimonas sp. KU-00592-HH]|uniref:response regulator n=1 Tax=Pelagimonas sp. KU-00592-HH TaxID=3127651 RepID=UPI003106EDF9
MRILVVDDDELFVDLICTALTSMGFQMPVCASSAEEALQLAIQEREPFSTFLLDINLPNKNGVDLCREIRLLPNYRMTPIIMITASKQSDLMERAFEAGATDFVGKPIDGLELGTRVKIAGMLNDSIIREKRAMYTLEDLTELTRVQFDEMVSLPNIEGVVDYPVLENMLLRMARACYAMSIFSIEAMSAKDVYDRVAPPYFVGYLKKIASILSESLSGDKTIITYAGKGVFLCVKQGRDRLDLMQVEDRIEKALDAQWNPDATFGIKTPYLAVSALSRKSVWTNQSALEAIQGFKQSLAQRDEHGFPEADDANWFSDLGQ